MPRFDVPTGPKRQAIYQRLLPDIRDAAWRLGYCIGVHGSMRRDLDVIAMPWIEAAAPPHQLAQAINEAVGGDEWLHVRPPSRRPHGRIAYSLHLKRCVHLYVDLSIAPRAPS